MFEVLDRLAIASLHLAGLSLILLALGRLPGAWRAWGWRLSALKALVLVLGVIALPLLPAEAPLPALPLEPSVIAGTPAVPALKTAPAEVGTSLPLEAVGLAAWAFGATAFGLRLTMRLRKASALARDAHPLPAHWPDLPSHCPRDRVALSSHVDTPMIVGLFRPRVLLPASVQPPIGWEAAVAHEVAHLRRRDLAWDSFVQAAACVFWFHPIAWLAVREHRMACEEASDALAIQSSGFSPRAYALVLVNLGRSAATGLSLGAPARALRRRIHAMHRHPLSLSWLLPLLLLAIIGFAPVALTATPVDPDLQPSRFDHVVSGMIGRSSVRRELGLSESTLKKMSADQQALYERSLPPIRQKMDAMKQDGKSPKEVAEYRNREMERFYRESTEISFHYLSEVQKRRLREIALQRYGTMALANPEIAQAAGIPTAKQQAIAKVREDLNREMIRNSQADFRRRRAIILNGAGLPPRDRAIYLRLIKKGRTQGLPDKDWKKVSEYEKRIAKFNRWPEVNPTIESDRRLWVRYTERATALLSPQELGNWRKLLGKPLPPGPDEVYVY